jgi:hypothetical protein
MLHSNRSRSPYEDGTKPVTVQAPNLLSLPGCGVLTTARLTAETAGDPVRLRGLRSPGTPASQRSRSARAVPIATSGAVAATGSSTAP